MADIDNFEGSWQGLTHGQVEDAIKAKVALMQETIDDAGTGNYTKPDGGIPYADLADGVKALLDKAGTALQSGDISTLQGTVTSLQTVLNALIGSDSVQGTIDTFNEVVAFLDGINSSDTLAAKLLNKVDKETGKGLSSNDYTTAEKTKLGSLPTNPVQTISVNGQTPQTPQNGNVGISVPTKVSELDNDEGFVTAQDVAGIVAATGDLTIVESSEYIDIVISHPELVVTQLSPMSASTKSGTFKVSGTHLKGDVTISTSATNWTLSADGGTTTSQLLTLSPTDGTLAETTITVAYSGSADSTGNTITIASSGATSEEVTANYYKYSGPTILADDTAISFKAGGGSTQQKTLAVQGVNLEEGISAAISGTDAGKFSVSPASISKSGGTASGTLTITYSPAAADSGTHTATLTLSSSGATSKVITLNGAVSTLNVSKQSMTFSTDQGVAVTDTFTVEGANLNSDITIEASGTGFSVSPQTIAHSDGTVASTTVTVTYSPSTAGSHSGSISIQSSGVTKTISLSGTATAATTSDENGRFSKEIGGNTIYFGRIEENGDFTNNVAVYNPGYNTSSASSTKYSGDIEIPATVACDGTTYNVTTIESYAFASCSGLTSLTLHEGLTTIKSNAIRDCANSNFTTFVIPNSVTSISNNCLYGCNKISNLTIGTGITSVGEYFYGNCGTGRNVVIPANVTSFPNYAFYGTTFNNVTIEGNISLWAAPSRFEMVDGSSVTIKATTPPTLNGYPFANPYSGTYSSPATLYVPSGAVNDYKTTPRWGVMYNSEGCMFPNEGQILAIPED